MKKSRYLALVLVVAIMLMGAGYAAWTDQVVISNNVETGYLEVQFIDPNYSATELSGSAYVNLQPVVRDEKTVRFALTNLYPGAMFTTLTEIQNKGSIPVKFDNAVVTFGADSSKELMDNITVSFDYWIYDAEGHHIGSMAGGANVPLTQFQARLNSTLANLQLLPGEYVSIVGTPNPEGQSIDQLMTYTVNSGLTGAESSGLNFDITFNWKQFNQ